MNFGLKSQLTLGSVAGLVVLCEPLEVLVLDPRHPVLVLVLVALLEPLDVALALLLVGRQRVVRLLLLVLAHLVPARGGGAGGVGGGVGGRAGGVGGRVGGRVGGAFEGFSHFGCRLCDSSGLGCFVGGLVGLDRLAMIVLREQHLDGLTWKAVLYVQSLQEYRMMNETRCP